MSASKECGAWFDRWWKPLLILFGILFVWFLVGFNPKG
jgi:hypothetical protein